MPLTKGKYILDDDGNALAVTDLLEWARWMEMSDDKRQLAWDEIGAAEISTVFLGLSHAFFGGPPVLWETMVFGGPLDGHQRRYTSREEALAGHAETIALIDAAGK